PGVRVLPGHVCDRDRYRHDAADRHRGLAVAAAALRRNEQGRLLLSGGGRAVPLVGDGSVHDLALLPPRPPRQPVPRLRLRRRRERAVLRRPRRVEPPGRHDYQTAVGPGVEGAAVEQRPRGAPVARSGEAAATPREAAMNRTRHAFTLVELLVVVAIIALLIAM